VNDNQTAALKSAGGEGEEFRCVYKAGWRGAFNTIIEYPILFGLMLLSNAAVVLLVNYIDPIHFAPHLTHAGKIILRPTNSPYNRLLRELVVYAFSGAISVPGMIAIHRHILLRENGHIFNNVTRLIRTAALFLVMQVVYTGLADVLVSAGPEAAPAFAKLFELLGLSLSCTQFWLIIRLVPVYPATALDMQHPLSSGWKLSFGRWWYIARTMVVGLAPVWLILGLYSPSSFFLYGYVTPENIKLLYELSEIVQVTLGLLFFAVAAALASEIYRRLGGLEMPYQILEEVIKLPTPPPKI
jgi:hypothetical protein